MPPRRSTSDADAFYARFPAPALSDDERVEAPSVTDRLWVGDARLLDEVADIADRSVGLLVTSPPYFVGKDYESEVGQGVVAGSYAEHLTMLEDVLAACLPKLEPGGRMAVNVANLGRRPYRSLSADVVRILSERLGLLLRGEIVWRKAQGASGRCAWGSYRSPANPVLRDVTERVLVASKGRFGRALSAAERRRRGLPCEATVTAAEFCEATLDVWDIQPELASRVGHPAPFPVELPLRLINLYTYRGDLVLDPFMGSGTAAVAAVRSDRRYAGVDADAEYVRLAETRIAAERSRVESRRNAQPADGGACSS